MGLDIVNEEKESLSSNMTYWVQEYIKKEYQEDYLKLVDDEQYDEIISKVTIDHIDCTDPDDNDILKTSMNAFISNILELKFLIELLEKEKPTSEDIALAKKYDWVLEDETVSDSRMGSYSTIHYGRKLADLIDKFYLAQDINLSDGIPRKITEEELLSLLPLIDSEGTTSYEAQFFNNLCDHADCEDIYIPTQNRKDFSAGSSIILLKELDMLYEIDAVKHLDNIKNGIQNEYGENVQYATKELQIIHRLADNCEWVFRKMLFHAVCSVEDHEIIRFC